MKLNTVKLKNSLFRTLLCAGTLLSSSAFADERFTQNGQSYVLKDDLVGVIRKPNNQFAMSAKELAAARRGSFFDIYDAKAFDKANQGAATQKHKYKVVYKQITNPTTGEVKDVPALLTNNIIVEAKDAAHFSMSTPLQLKKSFQTNGYYIYSLPANKSISSVLEELSKEPDVKKALVEIVEHLRVPL